MATSPGKNKAKPRFDAAAPASPAQSSSSNPHPSYTAIVSQNSSARDMLRMGFDLDTMDQKKLATKRAKRGECLSCGTKLFKMSVFGKKKAPLNVAGKVMEGRCLICYPFEVIDESDEVCKDEVPREVRLRRQQVPPQEVVDDMTVVSGITLDHAFLQTTEISDEETDRQREVAGDGIGERQASPRARAQNRTGESFAPTRQSSISWLPPPIHEECDVEETKTEISASTEPLEYVSWQDSKPSGTSKKSSDRSSSGMSSSRKATGIHVIPLLRPTDSLFSEEGPMSSSSSSSRSHNGNVMLDNRRANYTDGRTASDFMVLCADEMPDEAEEELLLCTRLLRGGHQAMDRDELVRCLNDLSSLLWAHGNVAKRMFIENAGLVPVMEIIWTDMSNVVLQDAALNLVLALVASWDGETANDVLFGDHAEGYGDAVLISMQLNQSNEGIQCLGCRILCCLASASSTNPVIDDGSLSGAALAVLNALKAHPESFMVHEWSVRALFNQCTLSKHSDSNKRSLVSSTLEDDEKGGSVIFRTLSSVAVSPNHPLLEILLQLLWSLTCDERCLQLPTIDAQLKLITSVARKSCMKGKCTLLLQACLGTIANLVCGDVPYDANDAIALALQSMKTDRDPRVATEACCLIANATAKADRIDDFVLSEGIVRALFDVALLPGGTDDSVLRDEGLRATTSLSDHSPVAKAELLQPIYLSKLMKLRRQHELSTSFQAMYCRLLASMCQCGSAHEVGVTDILASVCITMQVHSESEEVQEAACLALNVISSQEASWTALTRCEALSLVLDAMDAFSFNKAIQMHGCFILWNIMTTAGSSKSPRMNEEKVALVVKGIRNHLESIDVLSSACGFLWSLLHGDDRMKQALLQTDGAIDALTCVLVMHPESSTLLEKVVGILSGLSSSPEIAKEVVTPSVIEGVLEVIRASPVSLTLLRSATLFVRNAVIAMPSFAVHAERAISVVINWMKEYPDEVDLQKEACSLLWVLSASSIESKSKILALDGISVLMNTLENCRADAVQDAALGAFHELAITLREFVQ